MKPHKNAKVEFGFVLLKAFVESQTWFLFGFFLRYLHNRGWM